MSRRRRARRLTRATTTAGESVRAHVRCVQSRVRGVQLAMVRARGRPGRGVRGGRAARGADVSGDGDAGDERRDANARRDGGANEQGEGGVGGVREKHANDHRAGGGDVGDRGGDDAAGGGRTTTRRGATRKMGGGLGRRTVRGSSTGRRGVREGARGRGARISGTSTSRLRVGFVRGDARGDGARRGFV